MTKTLPKYNTGQIVISNISETYPFSGSIVSSSYDLDKGWYYNFGDLSQHEDTITHVLNSGYWVPADQWNGNREYDAEKIAKDMYDEMMYEDPDEQEFIEEQKKIFKESKSLRDDKDQATEDA